MPDPTEAREEIPMLMEKLKDENPRGAKWVEDVFSEVFSQLRQKCVKDPEMVDWLYESIHYHRTHIPRFC